MKPEDINLAQKGDVKAFERVITEIKGYLYSIAISMLANDDDAGDAISETIINAFKYIKKLKKEEYFKTWITRILINECKKILKKKRDDYNLEELDENLKLEVSNTETEDIMVLKDSINELKPELRSVIILFYYNELSIKEISKILKIPAGTVKSRMNTAKSKLKELMKERSI